MGVGNKLDPGKLEVADIYDTSICPLAKVMRKELRKRNIPALKVIYSREEPVTPIPTEDSSCSMNCICPPGTARKCTVRRQIPGSISFVPPVAGLLMAGEAIRSLIGWPAQ
jgi:tRNA A37 threonylcarbamoyladenosine dehydratase